MRLNTKTIVLIILCLGIVIVVGIFQDPLQNMLISSSPTPSIQTMLPFDIDNQATQVIVRQGDDFTQIDKIDGLWQVVAGSNVDNSLETNHDFVVGLLSLMSTLEYSRVFTSEDLAQYGLDNSLATIAIRMPDTDYSLRLGQTNPDGDQLYMQVNDATDIYLVPAVFEFANIMRLASNPPYLDETPEVIGETLPDNLLFPDVFGYQVAEFKIRDGRDGSTITYTQGDQGTWIVDGSVVNTELEIDHVQAAINVSQFLFLAIEPADSAVMDAVTDLAILTLSITTQDDENYEMSVYAIDELGYVGRLRDAENTREYVLPTDTVNQFFDMVREPPYATLP
jgi:hypothetical protein